MQVRESQIFWKRIGNRKKIAGVVFMAAASILYCLFFSRSTSPLYEEDGTDSYIFLLMGRELCRGNLPYTELTENKGPLLFYIEALGQFLLPGRYGVFAIQMVFMFLKVYFLNRICFLITKKYAYVGITLTFLLSQTIWYEYGNLSEEYNMFFVIITIYFFAKLYEDREQKNARYFSLIQGACLGAVFMIRMNDCLSIGIVILWTLGIIYGTKKDWKRVKQGILYIVSGFIIVVLMTSLPYILAGVGKDLVRGYLYVNKEYVETNTGWINFFLERWNLLWNTYFGKLNIGIISCGIFVTGFGFYLSQEKGNRERIWYILCLDLNFAFLISSIVKISGYLHYSMFLSISITLFVINIKLSYKRLLSMKQIKRWVCSICFLGLMLPCITLPVKGLFDSITLYRTLYIQKAERQQKEQILLINSYIDKNKDKICLLGVNPLWYWVTDTVPGYKELLTLTRIDNSDVGRREFDKYLFKESPYWIIFSNNRELLNTILSEEEKVFIETFYEFIYKNEFGSLYKFRE